MPGFCVVLAGFVLTTQTLSQCCCRIHSLWIMIISCQLQSSSSVVALVLWLICTFHSKTEPVSSWSVWWQILEYNCLTRRARTFRHLKIMHDWWKSTILFLKWVLNFILPCQRRKKCVSGIPNDTSTGVPSINSHIFPCSTKKKGKWV